MICLFKEIVLNPAITDGAIYWLTKLKSLRRLHLYFLPYVSHRKSMLRHLRLALPRCTVTFPEEDKIGAHNDHYYYCYYYYHHHDNDHYYYYHHHHDNNYYYYQHLRHDKDHYYHHDLHHDNN
ncbi:unnamed protein product [Toxocara canis]|uniref:Uncharacterized protein n=1 Tax=Toxocara canis TaxID=6265 RepID=A0A3P7IUG4_TOXCA|nr:unnamed protein product [Toxocara canis]